MLAHLKSVLREYFSMTWFRSNCNRTCLFQKTFSLPPINGLKCNASIDDYTESNKILATFLRLDAHLGSSVESSLLFVDKKGVGHPDQLDVVRSYHQLLKTVLNAKIYIKGRERTRCLLR